MIYIKSFQMNRIRRARLFLWDQFNTYKFVWERHTVKPNIYWLLSETKEERRKVPKTQVNMDDDP